MLPVIAFRPTAITSAGAAIAVLLCASGCLAPKTIRPLGSAVAIKGQEVSSAALSAYDELAEQADIDVTQQDFLKVATSPDPNHINLTHSTADVSKQLLPRVAAYRQLFQTYSTYQTLTDKTYGQQAGNGASSLLASLDSLKGIPDIPGVVNGALAPLTTLITEAQQSRDIRRHNRALIALSKAYQLLWKADIPVWKQYLDGIYNPYADGILSLDADRFDAERLSDVVEEPFSKELNVGFYKLQHINKAKRQRDNLLARLQRVDQAFDQLTIAQTELANAKPNLVDALAALDAVDGLLGEVKK